MRELELLIPTLFGLEGLCAEELRRLGLPGYRRRTAGCAAAPGPRTSPGST